ncbi:MAG: EAL domain-containing protein [Candidatus Competibacteraceae bacterium]
MTSKNGIGKNAGNTGNTGNTGNAGNTKDTGLQPASHDKPVTTKAVAGVRTQIVQNKFWQQADQLSLEVSRRGIILNINRALPGMQMEQCVGASIYDYVAPEQQERVREALEFVFTTRQPASFECHLRTPSEFSWWWHRIHPLSLHNRMVSALIISTNMTEARQLWEQTSHQIRYDALTGLLNRTEFENALEQAVRLARLERIPYAVCYLDLDQFRMVNELHGRAAGDQFLRQVAALIRGRARRHDTVARLGGDAFGLLMENCTLDQAWRIAQNLQAAIASFRFVRDDRSLHLQASIGLAPLGGGDDLREADVLRAADAACQMAKELGRNRIHIFHPDDARMARRLGEMQWLSRIHQALDECRLSLCFQPIVPTQNESAVTGLSYEVLLRLTETDGSVVLPGAFLPIAERYGLIRQLDRWVTKTTLEWLTSHPEQLARLELCYINLSGQSLAADDFLKFVEEQFALTHVPPQKICFEITETAAIADLARVTHVIQLLREMGCRFALDDFGSGLCSLAYLKNLPVDYLKIDGAFVRDIAHNPISSAMVRAINEIGQLTGKKTIAEFVENPAIIPQLGDIGVDFMQGYAISTPQPLKKLTE